MTFVIDTSTAINLALGTQSLNSSLERLYAPALIDIEFAHAMRRMALKQELPPHVATAYVTGWANNNVIRCPLNGLLLRIWELRDSITPYDATFVATAERLRIPLLTSDRRLARAAEEHCEVQLLEA